MKNSYAIEYLNENEFRKKERAVKKYQMLAYKKLVFDYYPSLRDGNFIGFVVSKNDDENIVKYELKLPTDENFSKIHGDIVLHYSVYLNQNIVMLETITPEKILNEGHRFELTTYKGVPVSKTRAEKDMFKINLLCMLAPNDFEYDGYYDNDCNSEDEEDYDNDCDFKDEDYDNDCDFKEENYDNDCDFKEENYDNDCNTDDYIDDIIAFSNNNGENLKVKSYDMNKIYDDLIKLKELLDKDIITKEEFEKVKNKILNV